MPAAAPSDPDLPPWPALRARFAELVAAAGGIGALYVVGLVDYFLGKRLRRSFKTLLADVRIALMDRAIALLSTLGSPRAVTRRVAERPGPRMRRLTSPAHLSPPPQFPGPRRPYPGFGPRILALCPPYPETVIPARIPFAARLALRPVFRTMSPAGAWGRAKPESLAQSYFEIPEKVPVRALARLLEALARILDDPDTYARRLALKLRREARDADAAFSQRRTLEMHHALGRLAHRANAARKERIDPLAAPWPSPLTARRGKDPPP